MQQLNVKSDRAANSVYRQQSQQTEETITAV